jgi:hypothetical protein
MFAQNMQEVGRYEEAQVQWNFVTQLLTALKNEESIEGEE